VQSIDFTSGGDFGNCPLLVGFAVVSAPELKGGNAGSWAAFASGEQSIESQKSRTSESGTKRTCPTPLLNVRYRARSGKHLLAASISGFDPDATSTLLYPMAFAQHFVHIPGHEHACLMTRSWQ
jgi:hypothetical protein